MVMVTQGHLVTIVPSFPWTNKRHFWPRGLSVWNCHASTTLTHFCHCDSWKVTICVIHNRWMDRISNNKDNLRPKHIKCSQQQLFFPRIYWHEYYWVWTSVFPNSWFLSRRMFSLYQSTSSTAARQLDFLSNHFLTTPATVCCCSDISLLRYPPMWCELLISTTALTMNIFPTPHSCSYIKVRISSQNRLVLAHLFRTVSSSLHLVQWWLPQSLVGQLQLVSEPAQVPLCFGLDDTQLCVDVLVLIGCIFFVLQTQCLAVEI